MALTHPLAADWPRWLRSWWGLIQPPALLLRVAAFPTLTRLPSPSLFPSLSLNVLRRLNSFLSSSLPFLDAGGGVGPASTTPRFDYRTRRPRTAPVRNAPLDLGAYPHAELSAMRTDGSVQLHESLQPQEEETHLGLVQEPSSPAGALPDHETAGAESIGREPAPETSLTPFQESEWDLPAPASGHVPTLEDAVQHADEWREAWSAVDLPAHVPQTIGVLRSTIGSTLRSALVHGTTLAAHETDATASHPDLTSELGHVLDARRDSAVQMLSGLENASPLPMRTDLRMPGYPFQRSRRIPPGPPPVHELPSEETSALPESAAAEHWPDLGEIAETTAYGEARQLSPFSVLEAVQHASPLLTQQRNPILGEVLHRQERAVEALSLVAHRPADTPGVHQPAAVAAGEPAGELARHQLDDLVSTFPVHFESLHRVANLPNMALQPVNIIEERAGSFLGTLLPETHGSEASAMPEHESQESIQSRRVAQATDRMLMNGTAHAGRPLLDLLNPLATLASTFRPPSLQLLRHMVPAGAEMGIAARANLPDAGHSEPAADRIHPVSDVHQRHQLSSDHFDTTRLPRSLQAAALTAGEQLARPPGRMNLGSSQSPSLLGHEAAHTDHPLALRPLPDIANLLVEGVDHVAQLPEQVLQQSFAQELLPPPSMEVRREAHAPTSLAQAQSSTGGFTGGQWSDQTGGQAFDHRVAATPLLAETPAAETPASGGDSGATVWQSTGAGSGAGSRAGSGAADLDSLARQVFALLQSQLRAERDRHQIYDR